MKKFALQEKTPYLEVTLSKKEVNLMNVLQSTKPLTNLQIELLKIYSFDINEKQLLEIKDVLSKYFADKATEEMDRLWEEKGWTNDTMEEWLRGEEEANTKKSL